MRKEGIVEELAKTYLEKEYKIAVNYLFGDPEVSSAVKVITYSIPISVLIVAVISCSIFYFLIPLIDKKRSTLGYIIFRIIPVNSEDLTLASKKKIALRSAMFVFINYISLITLGLFLGVTSFSFIPFFINTVSICLSHSNSGLHDFGTKIIVINESRSSAMAALKQVSGGK